VREDVLDDFTTVELARDAYGVVFADEATLEIDGQATERLRADLGARADGVRSLTEYYRASGLVKVNPPTSVAGNREFGIE
jgi:hypothetical protein